MAKKKASARNPSAPSISKIAIIGTTPHRADAPYDDPAWAHPTGEIWGVGRWSPDVRRWDRWFEIHSMASLKPEYDDHLKYLADSGKPVFVHAPTDKIPNGIIYPRDAIIGQFHGTEFLDSTVAWMMAMAISHLLTMPKDQPRTIGIWGVDMATTDEYKNQRKGCKHFMHLAKMSGIEVLMPPLSDLLREKRPYPDPPTAMELKIQDRMAGVQKMLGAKIQEFEGLKADIANLRGMEADLQYFIDNWTDEKW